MNAMNSTPPWRPRARSSLGWKAQRRLGGADLECPSAPLRPPARRSRVPRAVNHVGCPLGADQGLLNTFFGSWPTADIRKHLPFIYNLSSNTAYTYSPAFKQ